MGQVAQAIAVLLGGVAIVVAAMWLARRRGPEPGDVPPRPDLAGAAPAEPWRRPTLPWKIVHILLGAVISVIVIAFANLITALLGRNYAETSDSTTWVLFLVVGACIYAWWRFVYGTDTSDRLSVGTLLAIVIAVAVCTTIVDAAFSPPR